MMLLEVCVDHVEGMQAAAEGGADRIELCSSLDLGGLTPSAGLMAEARCLAIPVIALIRPRSGGFVYSAAEERVMLHDIECAASLGLAGIAIGALRPDGGLDVPMLRRLAARAAGLQLTLHRAFDLVRQPATALEEAVDMGFTRILTSGGAPTAQAGAERLAALVAQSRGRIRILAGSGITPENVGALLAATQAHEVHASCRTLAAAPAPDLVNFGFSDSVAHASSAARVRELRRCALAHPT